MSYDITQFVKQFHWIEKDFMKLNPDKNRTTRLIDIFGQRPIYRRYCFCKLRYGVIY